MKKFLVAALLLSSFAVASQAQADRQTVSLGYAQSKVQDFKNLQGVNVKYRYEWDSPVSIIGSFTWMEKKADYHDGWYDVTYSEDVKVRYYSLMAGPAWRLNEQFSLYALGGIGWGKVDYNQHYNTPVSSFSEGGSETDSNFAYGAGVQFNATENLVIDAGYQGGKIMDAKTNGFNVGVGYRF